MNVLQVNYTDKEGQRFNGGALIKWLRANGHSAKHGVGVQQVFDNDSFNLTPHPWSKKGRVVHRVIRAAEEWSSLQNILYPQSFLLPFNKNFKRSDVVHYHIIHNDFFSYLAFPWLTNLKPSVWTLHDPWAITGHCIHPFECTGWLNECSSCPHLDFPLAIRKDRAWLNYKLKKFTYKRSKLDLIVSSSWMKEKIEKSPIFNDVEVHQIPFGLDLDKFCPGNKSEAKAKLGIAPDRLVVGLRALGGVFKGLEHSLEAIKALPDDLPLSILTCDKEGLCASVADKFPIVELGDIAAEDDMVRFFRALDVHLMASMAESFGMMAMEAAACGVPSVVFSGTPLVEVCFAPEGGLVAERGSSADLSAALLSLLTDSAMRNEMGMRARELSMIHYDFDRYARDTLAVYEGVLSKRGRQARDL